MGTDNSQDLRCEDSFSEGPVKMCYRPGHPTVPQKNLDVHSSQLCQLTCGTVERRLTRTSGTKSISHAPRLYFCSALQQSLATTSEFVGDEAGEEVDRGHGFSLSLAKAGFEHGRDSAQS